MQDSVQKVEKYFGQLCNNMGGITRKTARLRDKYDLLAKVCNNIYTFLIKVLVILCLFFIILASILQSCIYLLWCNIIKLIY